MMDAGILIPAALVTIPMPNCGHLEIQINFVVQHSLEFAVVGELG
jgi:hypothetical protein